MSRFTHAAINSVARPVILSSLVMGLTLTAAQTVHASKADRAKQCLTKGDADTSRRISHNVVKASIEKWKIADLVKDEAVIKNAEKELYGLLKYTMGGPAAICAQYVTADTAHFIKGYSDEAAAALLGMELPDDQGKVGAMPRYFVAQLKVAIDKAGDAAKAKLEAGDAAKAKLEEEYGIPPEVSAVIINELKRQPTKAAARLTFNMPRKWDIDNRLVQGMIKARRSPQASLR
jgi:hypothetical protein